MSGRLFRPGVQPFLVWDFTRNLPADWIAVIDKANAASFVRMPFVGGNEGHYPKPLVSVGLSDLGQVIAIRSFLSRMYNNI